MVDMVEFKRKPKRRVSILVGKISDSLTELRRKEKKTKVTALTFLATAGISGWLSIFGMPLYYIQHKKLQTTEYAWFKPNHQTATTDTKKQTGLPLMPLPMEVSFALFITTTPFGFAFSIKNKSLDKQIMRTEANFHAILRRELRFQYLN